MAAWVLAPPALYAFWLGRRRIPWHWAWASAKVLVFSRRGVVVETNTPLIACHVPAESALSELEALQIACSLIAASASPNDPISSALMAVRERQQWTPQPCRFVQEISGRGLGAMIGERAVLMGSEEFMKESSLQIPPALERERARQEAQGRRVLYLGWQAEVRAIFVFQESSIEGSDDVVHEMRKRFGVSQVVVASGASRALAGLCGDWLGADECHSGLSISQKRDFIRSLHERWGQSNVLWLEPRTMLKDLLGAWRRRFWARTLTFTAMLAVALGALSFLFAGCSWNAQRTLRGYIVLDDGRLETLSKKPNAVCFLIAQDEWNVPVIIKRWINPRFPLFFKFYRTDMLSASRPWKGPFKLEAYLYSTENLKQELPPPANAARGYLNEPVYPQIMQSLEIRLKL